MKEVLCVETGDVYPSAASAARHHNLTPGMINHVLKGRQATAGGYRWEYTGQGGKQPFRPRYKGVYRDRSGAVYNSLQGFAKRHGYTIRQVQAAISDDGACRLINLPIGADLFAPISRNSNRLRIRYERGVYYINDKPAGDFPCHPQMTEALRRARETGEVVSLVPAAHGPSRMSESEYWSIVQPAIETYKKRGTVLTRAEHEARRIIRETWITAHPPTIPDFEGTPDRWRPIGADEI